MLSNPWLRANTDRSNYYLSTLAVQFTLPDYSGSRYCNVTAGAGVYMHILLCVVGHIYASSLGLGPQEICDWGPFQDDIVKNIPRSHRDSGDDTSVSTLYIENLEIVKSENVLNIFIIFYHTFQYFEVCIYHIILKFSFQMQCSIKGSAYLIFKKYLGFICFPICHSELV